MTFPTFDSLHSFKLFVSRLSSEFPPDLPRSEGGAFTCGMFLLYSNLDKVFSLEQSYDSHDTSPSSAPNLLHKSSPSSTPSRRSKCSNNNNDNTPRELRKMTSLVIPLTSHSPPPLLSPRSSSSSSLLPQNTNNSDEEEQKVTSPLSRKEVNSFDDMRGDLEFFQTKEKVDEHQLSILNFVKAEVVLLETKILVVICESLNPETSNPHLQRHNDDNNDDLSQVNGGQFGLGENFISESQNQNLHKVAMPLDDKYIIPKNGDDQDNYFTSVAKEYGIDEKSIKTVTTIDLFYSQIYSSFRSDRTNYFTIVNVNGQKLNYYYFRTGEEKYYEWISKIQRNIKYSLYQKQQLYKRSKSILLTSNYTSSSSVKQMRRSYRCFDDHPFVSHFHLHSPFS